MNREQKQPKRLGNGSNLIVTKTISSIDGAVRFEIEEVLLDGTTKFLVSVSEQEVKSWLE